MAMSVETSFPASCRAPLSVVIPTRNEERNLRDTLLSVVGWADEVVVFDSVSEDRTLEIARSFELRVVQRSFDNFSAHKNWALANLGLRNDWIFFLDADERPTPELREEIARELTNASCSYAGFYVARKNYFMGRWIRHAGMYPDWNLRLFKRHLGRYEDRIVHEHVLLNGPAGYLRNPLEHNDFKGLSRWLERHNVYTSMEAVEIRRLLTGDEQRRTIPARAMARGPHLRRRMKELAYRYVPCRPLFTFVWMYVIRAGFLDGQIGFRYCLLKSVADYLTDLKLLELRAKENGIRRSSALYFALGAGAVETPEPRASNGAGNSAAATVVTKCAE
jgi:glycosyltransferase involved in cell wall biosynthesis